MDVKVIVALVGGCAATLAPAISYYFTKKQERSVARHSLKLDHYREFIDALAGVIDGEATDDGKMRYSRSTNTMYLIASNKVLQALQDFLEGTKQSNSNKSAEAHDRLLSRLVWEIRNDLGDSPTPKPDDFEMRLWASGVTRPKSRN
jgi:hypothetical protein